MIAGGYALLREGLRRLIEAEPGFRVVGQADDAGQALKLARDLKPHILLLDLAIPGPQDLEALAAFTSSSVGIRTILLVEALWKSQVKALQRGARGVVLKDSKSPLLFKSFYSVLAGEYWVGGETVSEFPEAVARLRGAAHARPSNQAPSLTAFGLTPRELQILSFVASGWSNKEIAQKASVKKDTVKHHLTNIFDKTGAPNRLELALFAIAHNLRDRKG
jgi:two-component system, NarL family, nitrate/nitrite response regulator NarL